MMLKLGDHQLQMRHHRLCTDRPSLSLPTCRALGSEFGVQRIDVVRDRIGGVHRDDKGITIARSRAPGNLPTIAIFVCQPAISGRQVRCGCRQSIPSSEGLQEYPLW